MEFIFNEEILGIVVDGYVEIFWEVVVREYLKF